MALGGGHGAAQSLRAARRYATEITAVISVADDGGSSGRLRQELGIPAPGDMRRCIGALLPDDSPLVGALEHRFSEDGRAGHAFGNLLIATLAEITGDFAGAAALAARLVGAKGRVLPATAGPVVLKGTGAGGEISGQARINAEGGVSRVELVPGDAAPARGAVEAIEQADQVVLGPGSLFTSLLAATAVPALRAALATTPAQVVYVANLREQPPETSGFDVADHVRALLAHEVRVDVVLADPAALPIGELPPGLPLVAAPLALPGQAGHDPELLGRELGRLVVAGTGLPGRK